MQECYDAVKQRERRADERKSTADSAEEHGRPEADHRSSGRAGRGHTVVHVPSLSSISARRLQMEGVDGALRQQQEEKKAVQLVVRCVRRPVPETGGLVIQDSTDREGKVFRAHAPPICVCENLLCSLKL